MENVTVQSFDKNGGSITAWRDPLLGVVHIEVRVAGADHIESVIVDPNDVAVYAWLSSVFSTVQIEILMGQLS